MFWSKTPKKFFDHALFNLEVSIYIIKVWLFIFLHIQNNTEMSIYERLQIFSSTDFQYGHLAFWIVFGFIRDF